MEAVYAAFTGLTNGKYADSTQGAQILIKLRLTDTEQTEAEAPKAEVEQAEVFQLSMIVQSRYNNLIVRLQILHATELLEIRMPIVTE